MTFSTAIDSHPAKWKLRDAEKWKKRNGLPGWADEAVTRQLYNAKNPTDPLESPLVPNEEAEQGASSPGCDKDLEKGLPILRAGAVQASPERALKELCQQYAADPGRLKEIEMKVGVWGWDLERLENGTIFPLGSSIDTHDQPSRTVFALPDTALLSPSRSTIPPGDTLFGRSTV